jgi:lipopolysaccharide transport system ATP-binding protein
MSSDWVIKTNNLSKTYTGKVLVEALTPITIKINKGECVGLIGKNGTGKSTLLKILSSVLKPTTGNATIKGKLVSILELSDGFHPDLTGYENIGFKSVMLGFSKQEVNKHIDEIVGFSELSEEVLRRKVNTYSNGMLLRLGFSIITHLPMDILILDEVLHVGDSSFIKKCNHKLLELKKNGISLIMASHNLHDLSIYVEKAVYFKENDFVFDDIFKIQELYVLGEEKFQTRQQKWSNDSIKLQSVDLYPNSCLNKSSNHFFTVDKILIRLKINVFVEELKLDIVLNLFNSEQSAVVASNIFHADQPNLMLIKGEHSIDCEIPSNFLNKGLFFINFWFGDNLIEYFLAENVASFYVDYNEWEKKKDWTKDEFCQPVRPKFNWTINQ